MNKAKKAGKAVVNTAKMIGYALYLPAAFAASYAWQRLHGKETDWESGETHKLDDK